MLLLQAYLHLRALHSFPTRRSSDLLPRGRTARSTPPFLRARPSANSTPAPRLRRRKSRPSNGEGSTRRRSRYFPRSEEHTSELQSRGHLVCRLLLEKKKKTQHHQNH